MSNNSKDSGLLRWYIVHIKQVYVVLINPKFKNQEETKMKYYMDNNGDIWTTKTLLKLYKELKAETTDVFFPDSFDRFVELSQAYNNGELTEITR